MNKFVQLYKLIHLMKLPITLVIPTHNRPHYLRRALYYYKSFDFTDIVIADSSINSLKFNDVTIDEHIKYLYLPEKTLSQKIEIALSFVETEYVVMSADDDFIFWDGLKECLATLKSCPEYSVVCGNIICYFKDHTKLDKIQFAPIFNNLQIYESLEDDPLVRLKAFFGCYREIFYALHRTENLRLAFAGVGNRINQVYINEYSTVVVPIIRGKFLQLPILYQVREFVKNGGDRMAPNIDKMLVDIKYKNEVEEFLDFQSEKIAPIVHKNKTYIREYLYSVFYDFAVDLQDRNRARGNLQFDKKAGNLIIKLPVFGKKIVNIYRQVKLSRALKKFIRSNSEKVFLQSLKKIIYQFENN